MNLKDFLRECNQREVFKRLSIYIVSSWVILQVLVAIWEPLGIPQKSVTFLIIALLIGFPLYIFYLWDSRIKHTLNPEVDKDFTDPETAKKFTSMYFWSLGVIGALCLLSAGWIVKNNFTANQLSLDIDGTDKIAVLNFENDTGNPELDIIGKMTADWLIHGITEHKSGQVISPDVLKSYPKLMGANLNIKDGQLLNNLFQPSKIITGAYFLSNDTLVINCSIQSGSGEIQMAFPRIECSVDDSLECIESLKQQVVGYLVSKEDKELNLEETPPKFQAYKTLLEAKASYGERNKYIRLLDETIDIEPDYFEALILRVQYYYNYGQPEIADSLLQQIKSKTGISSRQNYLLNFCEALLQGKNDKIYRNFKHEYDITPQHLESNSTYMVILQQFLNKPAEVKPVYDVIDMSEFNLENCNFCGFRYVIMADAFNSLKEYQKTIDLLEPVVKLMDETYLKDPLIRAYAHLEMDDKINDLISMLELENNYEAANSLKLKAADQYLVNGDKQKADAYYSKAIKSESISNGELAHAQYFIGDYKSAEQSYSNLMKEDSTSTTHLYRYAASIYKNGDVDKANEVIQSLEKFRDKYDYGDVDYGYAAFHSAAGNKNEALKSLLKSVAQGHRYYRNLYDNDPHFVKYKDSPLFQEILTFWH